MPRAQKSSPPPDLAESAASERAEPARTAGAHFADGVDWAVAGWIALVHLGALAAPWTFSWPGLVAMCVLYVLTGGIGICMGYHRLLSHQSFQTFAPIRWLLAWLGGLAGEGSAIHWSANHRRHHACSDQQGDPHSPREGFWWSHCLWCLQRTPSDACRRLHER
ncbi:MAG: acyl-CoA desaturase, partial [Pirellulales bacterium]|nr:acyl-CoA desaturase [Pirellulales bacterium]